MSSFSVRFYSFILLYSVFNDHFLLRTASLCLCRSHPLSCPASIPRSTLAFDPRRLSTALVGSSGLEPPTSRLSGARSNHLSYEPIKLSGVISSPSPWWRWWDSNPWPPACRAGALPTELHPRLRGSPGHWKLNNMRSPAELSTFLTPCSLSLVLFLYLRYDMLVKTYPCLHKKEVIQPHLPIRLYMYYSL